MSRFTRLASTERPVPRRPRAGATDLSYVATQADVGSTLRVVVTADNSVGTQSATSGQSSVVGG